MSARRRKRIPEFRGAPTREGRLIVGMFGGIWVFFALFGMIFSLITETGADLIAPVYGSMIFLAVGLSIWMLAFPNLVNSALRSENRLLLAVWPYRANLFAGGLFASMGLFPVMAALSIIPMDNAAWPAPPWIGAIAGGMFLLVGVYILALPWVKTLKLKVRRQLLGLVPLLIFTGFAAIADWAAFGPGEREFGFSAGTWLASIRQAGDALIGRMVFGISGVFLTIASLIGWWRYLRGKW